MLIEFLILMIVLLIVAYAFSKNIFSPSCIFCMMFIMCISFASYAAEGWQFQLSAKGFFVLACGVISFVASSLFVNYLLHHHKRTVYRDASPYVASEVHIGRTILIPFTLLFFSMAFYYYFSLCKVTGVSGANVASAFRNMSRANEIEMGIVGRWTLNILRGISTAIVVMLVNNYFSKSFFHNHGVILAICVMIYISLTLLSGERTSVIRIMGVAVLSFGVFWKRNNPNKVFPIKYLIFGILLCIGILYGFSAIRFFVGRSSQLDFIDYIAFYFGSPLYNLDYGVNNPDYIIGNKGHTFLGITNNLARLGLGNITSVHRMNITSDSLHVFFGNTYTCMFDYYADFGISGVIILMALFGIIITYLYCLALYAKELNIYRTVIYTFFGTAVIFAAFTEQIYGTYIAINTLIVIMAIVVTIKFLTSRRLRALTFVIGKLV